MQLPAYLCPSRHGVLYFRWPLPRAEDKKRRTIRISLRTKCPDRAGDLARHLASCGRLVRDNKALARLRQDGMREMVRSYFTASLDRYVERLNDTGLSCASNSAVGAWLGKSRPMLPRTPWPRHRWPALRIAIPVHSRHRALDRGGDRAIRRQRRQQASHRPGRNDQWPVQGRGHPPARSMAQLRCRGTRHIRTGRLVQQSPPVGAHGQHPAPRSRGRLPCGSGKIRHGRVTKINQPPANPARVWMPPVWQALSSIFQRGLRSDVCQASGCGLL